jgi:hypothetical protein
MLVSQPPTILSFGPASRVAEIFQLGFVGICWTYSGQCSLRALAWTIGGYQPMEKLFGCVFGEVASFSGH